MALYNDVSPNDQVHQVECGTAGCIAGHVAIAFKDELDQGEHIHIAATEWLDLNEDEGDNLFLGRWSPNEDDLNQITLKEAIEHLETLRHETV